jgi:hypothetical protein
MTLVLQLFLAKYSARRQALVFESSPPITTKPLRSKFLQCSREDANYSGVSILCLPDPIISNPPIFL